MKKSLITLSLASLLLFLINPYFTNAQFSGAGAGTDVDPYIITTNTHLNEVRNDLTAYYELGADLDLTFDTSDPGGAFYNGGEGWEPIGSGGDPFTGSFDGQGFSITGLTIDRSAENSIGLFSTLGPDANIMDFTIDNADITGQGSVGVLAGGSNIALSTNGFSVTKVATEGSVTGTVSVGGLMGSAGGGNNAFVTSISLCYSTVDVSGGTNVGGLIGAIFLSVDLKNCYARGDVSGTGSVGGFIGKIGSAVGNEANALTACYASGLVTATTSVGGLIGESDLDVTITDSYWNMETTTIVDLNFIGDTQLGDRLTNSLMQNQQSFGSSWDFTTVWNIDEETSYPFLRDNIESPSPINDVVPNTLPFAAGTGTEESPWEITTINHLNNIRDYLADYFLLKNDLDLTIATGDVGGDFYNDGNGWEPIENFQGNIDGGGFSINGLTINRVDEEGVGFIGLAQGITIQNLKLTNIDVSGMSAVGGLVGSSGQSSAESYYSNIGVEGDIESVNGTVGGVFGGLRNADVEKSYMQGSVTATGATSSNIGGIAGFAISQGANDIGIVDSYVVADLSGGSEIGGIVGQRNSIGFTNCYFSGSIEGENGFNELVGASSNSTINSSYWDAEVACTRVGNIVSGNTSNELTLQSTFSGWDFTNVWSITEEETYPFLQWQGSSEDYHIPPEAGALQVSLPDRTSDCEFEYDSQPMATNDCGDEIAGTPQVPSPFPITEDGTTVVTWVFEDNYGNTLTQTQNFIITANEVAPTPQVTDLPDLTDVCSVDPDDPFAEDDCDNGVLRGVADVDFPVTAQGTTVVTWTYTDSDGNETTQTQNIIIDDTEAPVPNVTQLADITDQCQLVAASAPTATDNCKGQINGIPDVTFPITTQGTTTITWTFTDDNGNSVTQQQNVVISDDTEPVPNITTLPTITTDCEGVVEAPDVPTATDNCAGSVIATTNQVFPFTPTEGTQILWTYNDGNGNTAIQFQDIIIVESDAVTVEESLCEGAEFTFPDGTVWSGESSQVSTLTNQQDCDSLVTTNITVLPLPAVDLGADEVFGCVGEELTFSIDESSIEFETYTISTLFGNSSTDGPLTFEFSNAFAAATTTSQVFVTIELTNADGCVGTDQVQLFDNTMINWGIGIVQNNDPQVVISSSILPETADTFEWDFGDGTTNTTDINPTHTYTENGNYDITLTVSNECGEESQSSTITIAGLEPPLAIEDVNSIKIYPNPTTNSLKIDTKKSVAVKIFGLSGKAYISKVISGNELLDVSQLPAGQYIVQLYEKGTLITSEKIIKVN